MINPEDIMMDLATHLEDDDLHSFFRANDIVAREIDSYVVDADDHGYTNHDIWKVELMGQDPFYFVYEWDTYYNGDPARIFLAAPYEEIRYSLTSDNFREMIRDEY